MALTGLASMGETGGMTGSCTRLVSLPSDHAAGGGAFVVSRILCVGFPPPSQRIPSGSWNRQQRDAARSCRSRTQRFAATVFAINPAGPIDWGDLAGGAGYFDQAHFGHEFRAFTGLTPTRYVEVRRRFLREHPGHVLDGWPLPAD